MPRKCMENCSTAVTAKSKPQEEEFSGQNSQDTELSLEIYWWISEENVVRTGTMECYLTIKNELSFAAIQINQRGHNVKGVKSDTET